MLRSQADYDVVVIGGGPAGSSASRLLASSGHRVLLLTRPIDRARGLAESIPPSARKLLEGIGVLQQVERAGTPANRGNAVWWGSSTGRLEDFGEGGTERGFQIFRPDFDALLLAAAANVEVRIGATVRSVALHDPAAAVVEYDEGSERRTVTARFALDCSGRAGILARRGRRLYEPNHRMQAYLGLWRREAGWAGGDAIDANDRTMVETYEDGWAWSLAISPAVRQVAVMVDGATTRTSRGPTIAHAYRAELAKTRHIDAVTHAASLGHVWACDASLYSAEAFAGPQFLLVGDAGACIDPLSSFGVKKALASAWLGAIAVHTALVDPQRRDLAFDFFSAREREVYAADLSRTREFAALAFEHHRHPFWADRAARAGARGGSAGPNDPLQPSAALAAAHEQLRTSPAIHLRWRDGLVLPQRPLVRGGEIVAEAAVPLSGAALRYAHGIDLVGLGHVATRHRHVPDAFDDYSRLYGVTDLRTFLAALSLLLAERVLVSLDNPVDTP